MLIEKKGMKLLISIYKKQRFHELQLLQSQLPTIVIVESPVGGTHLRDLVQVSIDLEKTFACGSKRYLELSVVKGSTVLIQ